MKIDHKVSDTLCLQEMVKNSYFMIKGMVIIFLSTIEIFLFSGCCRNLQGIFIGILIHVLLILSVSIIFIEKEMQHILYYTEIFFNYLLIIPMYLNWHTGIDHYLILIYQIPLLLNYYISQNLKQLTILNINSIFVIGFCQRGLLLYSNTLKEVETEGVVAFFTMCDMILAIIISNISLFIKHKTINQENIEGTGLECPPKDRSGDS